MPGPLAGLRIVEFEGLGPGPFAAMVLSDLGATVLRVGRKSGTGLRGAGENVLSRSRHAIGLDLKDRADLDLALAAVSGADALIEGFRPGVMERLGLGPEPCSARNPRLVYGRVTGWGQDGPLAQSAGHDINYIALSGALGSMGTAEAQPPPLNLVGDFGGGGLVLAMGMLAALLEAARSGRGQVVDAAMTDGSALLMAMLYGLRAAGAWPGGVGENLLDGGAHFYATYLCRDGKRVAVGAIEPQFYAQLLAGTGTAETELREQWDRARWPAFKDKLAAVFATRTRDEWAALFEGTDACVAPVLDMAEAPAHPHNVARGTFVEAAGVVQPAPAPRFSRTPARAPAEPGPTLRTVLEAFGLERFAERLGAAS